LQRCYIPSGSAADDRHALCEGSTDVLFGSLGASELYRHIRAAERGAVKSLRGGQRINDADDLVPAREGDGFDHPSHFAISDKSYFHYANALYERARTPVRTQKAYKGNKKNAHLQTFPQKNYKDVHFFMLSV
jgi:hypothetical protein